MKYKIIIWGHKNNGHTHGHIHSSYFKAFKYLGYETYWFDDNDNTNGFNFNNCIFLTESQAQNNIPLNKTSKYILHHTNLDKYIDNGLEYINLANYLKWCDDGVSAYHKENTVIKINDCCFWDDKTKTIYQPWATDLTPNEIDSNNALKYNPNENTIYYVGTSHDNSSQINNFNLSVKKNNKNFIVCRTNTDKDNLELIRKSLISIDIRGDWHVECGYLPCRIFKNISYGRLTGTNSENVKKIFGDHVIYEPNLSLLYDKMIESENKSSIEEIKSSMEFIKSNHTFVNRINNLLKFLI
jgi:hypothetical protein